MKKGEVAWIKVGPQYHANIYHDYGKNKHVTAETKAGDRIWIKLTVDSIKRNPICLDESTYESRLAYFNTVRDLGKELVAEQEFSNA